MDAAYVFGTMGNLSAALGSGWSSEDEFSWAIGPESELTLPLLAEDRATILRFDVHPAIFPPSVPCQRLMIRAGKTVLGSFELTGRETLVIPLPPELTTGAERLQLTLIHPDATRPRDHLPVDDSRRLAVCFHSATMEKSGPEVAGNVSGETMLEPVHALIAGDGTALRICEVIGLLPSLKNRFGVRFFDLTRPWDQAAHALPPEILDTADLCWMQLNAGTPATRDPFRRRVPPACEVRTFYMPVMRSLWPFQEPDHRAVPEPGRYNPSRYPYSDRLAQTLVPLNLPDEVTYLMYEMAVEQEPLDLEDLYAGDVRRWRAEGRKSNMDLAAFIEHRITTSRLFIAPNRIGPILLRQMVDQILDNPIVRDIVPAETLSAELDTLLDGYIGWREEVPIHQRVAGHFNLSWWSPDMKYRWMNNLRTHREHILDTIRWVQWRP